MRIQKSLWSIAVFMPLVAVAGFSISLAKADDKDKDKQANDFAKQAGQASERAAQRERDKGSGTYDVKKSHDEHITATEKAAGQADKAGKDPDKK